MMPKQQYQVDEYANGRIASCDGYLPACFMYVLFYSPFLVFSIPFVIHLALPSLVMKNLCNLPFPSNLQSASIASAKVLSINR